MNFLGTVVVRIVESVKKVLHVHTYQVESGFVLLVLLLVTVISGGEAVEWIGVGAVFFAFAHAKVANRLAEREEYRQINAYCEGIGILSCHHKTKRYFIIKEMLWFVYFILLGAWSALVGVILFLLYEPWRKLWRTHHPLAEKLQKKN